jgi:hypothetical protein
VVVYKSFQLSGGLRYYSFLNAHSRFYVNALMNLDFARNSYMTTPSSVVLQVRPGPSMSLGVGFQRGIFSVEGRYQVRQDILRDYGYWRSEYTKLSLLLGFKVL